MHEFVMLDGMKTLLIKAMRGVLGSVLQFKHSRALFNGACCLREDPRIWRMFVDALRL